MWTLSHFSMVEGVRKGGDWAVNIVGKFHALKAAGSLLELLEASVQFGAHRGLQGHIEGHIIHFHNVPEDDLP
jgi:hypothetical protein